MVLLLVNIHATSPFLEIVGQIADMNTLNNYNCKHTTHLSQSYK